MSSIRITVGSIEHNLGTAYSALIIEQNCTLSKEDFFIDGNHGKRVFLLKTGSYRAGVVI